jgi:DNA-3-methyladenine glycosylase
MDGATPESTRKRDSVNTPRTATELAIDPLQAAPLLLGDLLTASSEEGVVTARIVEVEAYCGLADPASHSYKGKTARNAVMWGPAGQLYVYFVYGMHFCANVVCGCDGEPGAVLLRAGEIVDGVGLARVRRPAARWDVELGRGPARLTSALGIAREHNGALLTDPHGALKLTAGGRLPDASIRSGPRVGVAAAQDAPWRFWIDGNAAVSTYRRGGRKKKSVAGIRENGSRE